jgi:inorganic triphosphatase YgiF
MAQDCEIELKFQLDPAAVGALEQTLLLRARAKSPAPIQTLQSTY